jgi:hypothetical protein
MSEDYIQPRSHRPAGAKFGSIPCSVRKRKLRDAVGKHPALTFVNGESQTIGGFGRNDRFSYK